VRTAPANTCAVVSGMPGFPQIKTSSLVEPEIVIEGEGVVIRQSAVKDGKIVIPPGGLYYTVRTHWTVGQWRWPLANYPMLLLGKLYYLAGTGHNYGVTRDFVVKKREAAPYGMGVSALEASSIESSWGEDSPNQLVVFRVLKPSGNYYGNSWGPLSTGSAYARSSEASLLGGSTPDEVFFQSDRLASVGTSYITVKEVAPEHVVVGEWSFSEVKTVDLAEKATAATLGVGETLDLGKYKAKVLAIDSGTKTARVAIQSADGQTVAEKTLGPLTDKALSLLPSDDASLGKMLLQHDDVQVGLDAYRTPFKTPGKVGLVGYANIIQTTMGGVWKHDPRFVIFHDT
jgi:hypothetical protein